MATAGRDRQWYTQHPQGQSSLVSSSFFPKGVISTVVFGTVLSSSATYVGSEGHAEQHGSPATELAGIFQVPEQRGRAALLYCHGDKQAAADLLSTTSDKGKYKLDKFREECLSLFGRTSAVEGATLAAAAPSAPLFPA